MDLKTHFVFSSTVLKKLSEKVASNAPLISSQKADVFVLDDLPLAAVSLKIPLDKYLAYLAGQSPDRRPELHYMIPQEQNGFQLVINAPVVLKNGATFINGRQVVLV